MAASYYGIPRTTNDVDFIVKASVDQLDQLLKALEDSGLDVDPERIKRRLETGYNIVSLADRQSHNRADFIILKDGELDRKAGRALDLKSFYQTPEQLVLAKLRMIRATRPAERSYKDREDIRQILANVKLNRRSLLTKAMTDNTADILKDILSTSRPHDRRRMRRAAARTD